MDETIFKKQFGIKPLKAKLKNFHKDAKSQVGLTMLEKMNEPVVKKATRVELSDKKPKVI